MDTITTPLEREWFVKIVDRSKRAEYREIKPYWTSRLSKVRTRNGMNPPVSSLTVRIDGIVQSPKRKGRKRKGRYALHIGRVLKVEHWDRKKRKPKR